MNHDEELELAQFLISDLPLGEKFSLKELFREYWDAIPDKKAFGRRFKKAYDNNRLSNIEYLTIRKSGRCDEYQRT